MHVIVFVSLTKVFGFCFTFHGASLWFNLRSPCYIPPNVILHVYITSERNICVQQYCHFPFFLYTVPIISTP